MGGQAFKDPELSFPRIPRKVYDKLKAQVIHLLQQYFRDVAVPLEGPGKATFGDLDVLVSEPLPGPRQGEISEAANLAFLLKARLWKQVSGNPTINFALPWPNPPPDLDSNASGPTDNDRRAVLSTSPTGKGIPKPAGRFIQVDIHLCVTKQSFNWILFNHAHGDMWNILGGMIRGAGLLVNDKAFHILIPELAKAQANKNLTRVKITDEPRRVLQYLGLDTERFWRPFETAEELMEYAATCRFHDPGRGKRILRADEDSELDVGKVKTTTNERRRAAQRPLFKKWLEQYLPNHVDDIPGMAATLQTHEVVEDVKAFFGKDFATRYDQARERGIAVVESQRMWADIRELLKYEGIEGLELGYAMKGLKRCIQGEKFGAWIQNVVQKAAQDAKADPRTKAPTLQIFVDEDDSDQIPKEEDIEDIGYQVPGLPDVRRDFRELRYDLVVKWILQDNNWKFIAEKQREKDERESSEHLKRRILRGEQELEEVNDSLERWS